MSKKVTLEDIAREAGVSRATVSYVLNGKKKVSKEVAETIQAIANKYHYTTASRVVAQKAGIKPLIGFLVLPNPGGPNEDTFSYSVQEGIHELLSQKRYFLVYKRIYKSIDLELDISEFIDSVQGLILLNPRDDDPYKELIRALDERKVPHVLIGTPDEADTFYIDMDIESAAYQAAACVLKKGCDRVIFLNNPKGMKQNKQINAGYMAACNEYGKSLHEKEIIYVDEGTIEEGTIIARDLIRQNKKIDAFIAPTELLARGVLLALGEAEIRVPKDCKVVSLGGGDVGSLISFPSISAVDYQPYKMGYEAAVMLHEIITKKRLRPTHLVFPAVFHERQTS